MLQQPSIVGHDDAACAPWFWSPCSSHCRAAHAQSEAALKEYFEGRTVKLKLAMPGTEDGVDIYPAVQPLDYPRHAGRLKNYGTALRPATRRWSPSSRSSPS